jgi:hypothetical protein
MLVNYIGPQAAGFDTQDSSHSFFQQSSTVPGPGSGCGCGLSNSSGREPGHGHDCGSSPGHGWGGRSFVPPSSNNASGTDTAADVNENDNNDDDADNYMLAEKPSTSLDSGRSLHSPVCSPPYFSSYNVCASETVALCHSTTVPQRWLLLDSGSTTNIVLNMSLLIDVYQAPTPIWVHCNAGQVRLTYQGNLGNFPSPVWYNPEGVANILSLFNVTHYYRVTMDTAT